jgi:hypothetical protein
MNEIESGRYRHYKGNEYTVIGTARHSETLEEMVLYRQEYGEHALWVRPKQMFSETVKIDGRDVRRFVQVEGHLQAAIVAKDWPKVVENKKGQPSSGWPFYC